MVFLGLACVVASALPQDPVCVRLPELDHGGNEAGYVASLPRDRDARERWPLLLDFHGAIAPSRRCAVLTAQRAWTALTAAVPWLVVGVEGRTRAWGTITGEADDRAYARRVLDAVRATHPVDPQRIYLAGFSSGADWLCRVALDEIVPEASGRLVICPGPPNVVGLRDDALVRAARTPFLFVTGEEDHVRKAGAWEAFLRLDGLGRPAMYREVPRLGHEHPDTAELTHLLVQLERLCGRSSVEPFAAAREASEREDWLLASTILIGLDASAVREQLHAIERAGERLAAEAEAVDVDAEPGRAYEAWWRVRTQFHRFEALGQRAQEALRALEARLGSGRELHRVRREFFARRASGSTSGRDEPRPKDPRPHAPPTSAGERSQGEDVERVPTTSTDAADPFAFDRYLDAEEIARGLRELAARHPERARLLTLGRSIEGRDVLGLEITDRTVGRAEEKPGVYLQGALHGNEASSAMVPYYVAWQLAANPARRRAVEGLLEDVTFYVVPVVNPDGLQHHVREPHSPWRPRFNYRPHDADGDGRVDEDPPRDLDGDGEVSLMYVADPEGPFVLRDGRLVRGEGSVRYRVVGREGLDADGDGAYAEDPPGGVNLNRNFPTGFRARRDFEGTHGEHAASEPETQAVLRFLAEHPHIALFLDVHNDANAVFLWVDAEHDRGDRARLEALAERAREDLGYRPIVLAHEGAGLAIAHAYGALGIPALLVELERHRSDVDQDDPRWIGGTFVPARPFEHPQLGPILLGNDHRKLPRRNPHPEDIPWQADRVLRWVRGAAGDLARLAFEELVFEPTDQGFAVSGFVVNRGAWPTNTERARRLGLAGGVQLAVEGGRLLGGTDLGELEPGERRPFRVRIADVESAVQILARHPRAGTVRRHVRSERRSTIPARDAFAVPQGYVTPDVAIRADNAFYRDGVSAEERGPWFALQHRERTLDVAVVLGEWEDRRHGVPARAFHEAFFSLGTYGGVSATGQPVYGSVRDAYAEMSHGALDVRGRVFDWLLLPGSWTQVRDASFGSSVVQDHMLAALFEREGADVLAGFDAVVFVWSGDAVSRTSALWPMRLRRLDGGQIAFKMGERHEGEMTPIGVACHELGHTFGVDDKYGLGAGTEPLGPACLMAKGTHGGAPSGRHRPFPLCAWCRQVLGWIEPVTVDPATHQRLALRPSSFGKRECYRVLLEPDGSRYLLLENRRREGFLTDFPCNGLVVLRVGPNDKPASPQVRVQLVPAHGSAPIRRGVPAAPDRLTWPQPGRTRLVVDGVVLDDIRLVDDVVTFELSR